MSFVVHYNWSFSVKTFNLAYRKSALFIKMAQINIAKLVVSFSTICSVGLQFIPSIYELFESSERKTICVNRRNDLCSPRVVF